MPLQNRAAPDQCLHATPARGTLMGNRGGRFHLDGQQIGRKQWATKAWISCLLEFNDRPPRPVMADGYTELFFLDEATALASGHRPCFQCRYKDAVRFAELFNDGPKRAYVAEMDKRLHQERRSPPDSVPAKDLPNGAIYQSDESFYLVWQGHAHQWSFTGYGPKESLPATSVRTLTPSCVRQVLSAGYVPLLHQSV